MFLSYEKNMFAKYQTAALYWKVEICFVFHDLLTVKKGKMRLTEDHAFSTGLHTFSNENLVIEFSQSLWFSVKNCLSSVLKAETSGKNI